MIKPDGLDPAYNAAVVVRAIAEIDESSDDQRDSLLTELLCRVWGGPPAVNQ
jgi:hypothetical protein